MDFFKYALWHLVLKSLFARKFSSCSNIILVHTSLWCTSDEKTYICVTNNLFLNSAHKFKGTVNKSIKHFRGNILLSVGWNKILFLNIFI